MTALVPRHFDHVTASHLFGIGTFCISELDDQLVRLDLDPDDMILDEDRVLDLGGFVEVTSNRFYDEGLDLVCRDPIDASVRLSRSMRGPTSRLAETSL